MLSAAKHPSSSFRAHHPGAAAIPRDVLSCGLWKCVLDACGEVGSGGPVKLALHFVGLLLVLFGGKWFLQGINVLHGPMSGQMSLAVYGGVAVAAGVFLLARAAKKQGPKPS
jgi:hypothetical protein